MTKMPPNTLAELQRQIAIRDRQQEQYQNARPRARFAYAAHITKTERKIAWIINGLHGEDLQEALRLFGIDRPTTATPDVAERNN